MTILRDLSVIWAMINIEAFFLIMMEFRYPMKKLIVYSTAFLIPLTCFDLWFLFTYGPARMAQSLFFILLLPSVCFYFFLSKYRDGRFLYSFFLICNLNGCMTYITYLLDLILPGPRYLWMFILRLILFPLLNVLALRYIRKPYLRVQHSLEKGWLGFACITALFHILSLYLFSYPDMIENRPKDIPPLIITIILILFTNWIIFLALENQLRVYESAEQERLLSLQASQIEERSRTIAWLDSKITIERHDLRHRFHVLGAMLKDGNTDGALEYINASDSEIEQTEEKIWCANPLLNAVFSYYFSAAMEAGTRVEAELDIPEELMVDASQLSIVFANALENAIEAVKKLPESRRVIRCKCIRYPQLMFYVSNPYEGTVRFDSDGLPVSSGHSGIGSRSIAAYCEKHNAWCDYKTDNGWFTIQVTQP